jgi:hypothetical protein
LIDNWVAAGQAIQDRSYIDRVRPYWPSTRDPGQMNDKPSNILLAKLKKLTFQLTNSAPDRARSSFFSVENDMLNLVYAFNRAYKASHGEADWKKHLNRLIQIRDFSSAEQWKLAPCNQHI